MNPYIQLLKDNGADKKLIKHAELVYEVGERILNKLIEKNIPVDTEVVVGSLILHDAGKIIHPEELTAEGKAHLEAGFKLLMESNIDERIAKSCISHEKWNEMECSIEELVVALADTLWKGERIPQLERIFIDKIWPFTNTEYWTFFLELDNSLNQRQHLVLKDL